MKVSPEVLEVLEHARTDGPLLRLPGQLDRSLYVKVDKALKALGGRWDGTKHVRAHRFDQPAERVLALLRTGEVLTAKEKGYVPTPPEIAAAMISHLDVGPGDRVLEPSAGTGALIDALSVTGATVDAVESDRDHEPHLSRMQADGLLQTVVWGDFLSLTPPENGILFDLDDRVPYDAVARKSTADQDVTATDEKNTDKPTRRWSGYGVNYVWDRTQVVPFGCACDIRCECPPPPAGEVALAGTDHEGFAEMVAEAIANIEPDSHEDEG